MMAEPEPVGYLCSWCEKDEHRACTKYAYLDHPVPECTCPC